jgi:serine/threonine protein kinase
MNDDTQTFDDFDSTIGFDADSPDGPSDPPTVGERYRAIQLVGEGGMGEVWEAEQLEPVKRRVALKVIKQGMDTRDVVARFASERQTLALMEHPSRQTCREGTSIPVPTSTRLASYSTSCSPARCRSS